MPGDLDPFTATWSDDATCQGSVIVKNQPAYQRIAAEIAEKIATGEWPPGHRLPSNAKLQEQYGVSHMVIRTAMTILRDRGLVEPVTGVGVFVAFPSPTD